MKNYICYIRGENFLFELENSQEKVGFYTALFLKAKDEESAENFAIKNLIENENLKKRTLNNPNESPLFYVEEIEEIANGFENKSIGLAIFEVNDIEARMEAFNITKDTALSIITV